MTLHYKLSADEQSFWSIMGILFFAAIALAANYYGPAEVVVHVVAVVVAFIVGWLVHDEASNPSWMREEEDSEDTST